MSQRRELPHLARPECFEVLVVSVPRSSGNWRVDRALPSLVDVVHPGRLDDVVRDIRDEVGQAEAEAPITCYLVSAAESCVTTPSCSAHCLAVSFGENKLAFVIVD